jgi:hypothetical protein
VSDAETGVVVLISLSVICAVAAHALIRRPVAAAPAASLLFHVAAATHLGYVDKFAPVTFVYGVIYGSVIALLVGLPFRLLRRRDA